MNTTRRRHTSVLLALVAVTGIPCAMANCVEPGGFAIRQCADVAFFAPVPDPNFSLAFGDPNRPFLVTSVSAAFWQIGFGNGSANSGLGSDGTGTSAPTTFNGNDHGLVVVDVRDAQAATGNPGGAVPTGAVCLGVNNWGSAGVDGCCDDVRDATDPPLADDGLLNPYYDVYYSRYLSTPGYYSLRAQQDYPMAVLLRTLPNADYFAFAAVATESRGNDGSGANGPCHTTDPGTNPAPCDTTPGAFRFADVSNGLANAAAGGATNVVPWQATPAPIVTNAQRVVITDPNSDLRVDFHWDEVEIYSDQSHRPSKNVTLSPQTLAAAAGVGVSDVSAKFPLVRYVIEAADASDTTFSNPTLSVEKTSSPAQVTIPGGSCLRIRTLFGKKPQTGSTARADCRLGRCGDVGYEVVSAAVCPTAGLCVPTGPEICDNQDNDCDGTTDEFATSCGRGACASTGFCSAGNDTCAAGTPVAETCNNVDDDCDGTVDGFPTACGVGACATTGTCTHGADTCTPKAPTAEICDGLDNNCNGSTDEGSPGSGAACSTGQQGVCAAGTTACTLGSLQCVRNTDPTPETCDGLDNDCNGAVDNGNPGGGAGCGTGLMGACAAGTTQCQGGMVKCIQNNQPSTDVCDNVDNDCDGQIDEDFVAGPTTCGVGACASTGTSTCTNGVPGTTCVPGAPSAEICDGIDNNCNGAIDEGNPGGGTACATGQLGVCAAGTETCAGGSLQCVRNVAPSAEICNNLDDNCDGAVDAFPTTCGVGACASTGMCAAGNNSCSPGQPSAEICNGVDDDCDGAVDDNVAGNGSACSTGQLGVCAAGTQTCTGGAFHCARTAGPSAEICNDLDDNCDGTVDGFATTCGVGACASTGTCAAGMNSCTPGAPAGSDASCDGIDNDCNGQVDEDFAPAMTSCGVGACASMGVTTCALGTQGNTCTPGAPAASDATCNGVDDDCNGQIDEDVVATPTTCGVGACAAAGTTTCSLGVAGDTCVPGSPGVEICDGIDNDCDGTVDDVAGGCGFVVVAPTAGQVLDCATPAPPTIHWLAGGYDRYRVFVSWDPMLAGKKKISSGSALLTATSYAFPAKKWLRACANGGSGLYVAVFGIDRDLPKGNPLRKAFTPIVSVSTN
ncbi:MAG: hypothetical protein HY049_03105 [Acidobacteria bacterium]|nr:hypothetical protein [Acidobacteriota bacterium]